MFILDMFIPWSFSEMITLIRLALLLVHRKRLQNKRIVQENR